MGSEERRNHPDSRVVTAYHEAGHAVMAHLDGQRVAGLELHDDGELAGAFHSVVVVGGRSEPASLEDLDRRIRCALAGMAAEARLTGRAGWDQRCDDLDLAVRLAVRRVGECERVLPYLEQARTEVDALMAANWRAVDRLARRLLLAGRLDGAEARIELERWIPVEEATAAR